MSYETLTSHEKVQFMKDMLQSVPTITSSSNVDKTIPFIYTIPLTTSMIQCCIERKQDRFVFKYQIQRGKEVTIMIAEKQVGSKYYIFDCSRFGVDSVSNMKLNKKAGNYIGKLKKDPTERALYTLNDTLKDNQVFGIINYDIPSLLTQWRNGQPPRKIQLVIPTTEDHDVLRETMKSKLMEALRIKVSEEPNIHFLRSKEPVYEAGQYRLNFGGRVSVASVKNMQIINKDNELVFQFGKVGTDKFHLDFKAPLNAIQAFGIALSAMDL